MWMRLDLHTQNPVADYPHSPELHMGTRVCTQVHVHARTHAHSSTCASTQIWAPPLSTSRHCLRKPHSAHGAHSLSSLQGGLARKQRCLFGPTKENSGKKRSASVNPSGPLLQKPPRRDHQAPSPPTYAMCICCVCATGRKPWKTGSKTAQAVSAEIRPEICQDTLKKARAGPDLHEEAQKSAQAGHLERLKGRLQRNPDRFKKGAGDQAGSGEASMAI